MPEKGKHADKNAKEYNIKARAKYDAAHYDSFMLRVLKGEKERITEHAKKEGYKSRNAYIVALIEKDMDK